MFVFGRIVLLDSTNSSAKSNTSLNLPSLSMIPDFYRIYRKTTVFYVAIYLSKSGENMSKTSYIY